VSVSWRQPAGRARAGGATPDVKGERRSGAAGPVFAVGLLVLVVACGTAGICGYGRIGSMIALPFHRQHVPYVAVDGHGGNHDCRRVRIG